jgi:hypothetical protein
MKTCEAFKGQCCDSCHDDDDQGYGELPEVIRHINHTWVTVARVCCGKLDDAENAPECPR